MPKAVVLLSGGLDSTTVLYQALVDGLDCYALSFDYQQRHQKELTAARKIAQMAQVSEHRVVAFDLRCWGGSALTDSSIELPVDSPMEMLRDRDLGQMAQEIPVTYVPARNTIFLSFALAYAEAIQATKVYIGVNALDYSGYPDCRPEYIAAMQRVFDLGTKQGLSGQGIQITAPLINLHKAEIIQLGNRLGVSWADTWSCYDGGDLACGVCDSCRLRLAAFTELGLVDPVDYR
jgi:7-cyano-7-deazaguanine synthase